MWERSGSGTCLVIQAHQHVASNIFISSRDDSLRLLQSSAIIESPHLCQTHAHSVIDTSGREISSFIDAHPACLSGVLGVPLLSVFHRSSVITSAAPPSDALICDGPISA